MFGQSKRSREAAAFRARLHDDVAPLFDYWVDVFYSTRTVGMPDSDSDSDLVWRGFTPDASQDVGGET